MSNTGEEKLLTGSDPVTPLLQVRDLRATYGVRGTFYDRLRGRESGSVKAVDGASFDVRRGEVLGVVGESGSGKTTLGRTLLGLVEADGGSIVFDGQEIAGIGEKRLPRPPQAAPDRLPGPARIAQPGDDDRRRRARSPQVPRHG